jgi:hypothetical protein
MMITNWRPYVSGGLCGHLTVQLDIRLVIQDIPCSSVRTGRLFSLPDRR